MENVIKNWKERWFKSAEQEETPPAQAEKLMKNEDYAGLMELVIKNNLTDQFDLKEISPKLHPLDLFDIIDKYNLNVDDVLSPETKSAYIEELKYVGNIFKEKKAQGENFYASDTYKNTKHLAEVLGYDLDVFLKETYPKEVYTYPQMEQVKTKEDVQKLRDLKITDTDHREFPYTVVPMTHQPGGRNSQGEYDFAFAINSTDDIFPKEIFETLNKHSAAGDKPVCFITGTYTPGESLYVDEIQSDIIQRAQMYLQDPEEAKAKLQKRITEIEEKHKQVGVLPTEEDLKRIKKDKENLIRIQSWSSDFMPQYKQYRSKIQNYFSGWNIIAMNAILNFAQQHDIKTVFVRSADSLERKWLGRYGAGGFTKDLYVRMYDNMVQEKYDAKREGDWWKIDVGGVSEKVAKNKYKMIKYAEYEKLYEIYKPRYDESFKKSVIGIPEIAKFVENNISEQDWKDLQFAFWMHIPFYDETKKAIYLPETIFNKVMKKKEDIPSQDQFENEMADLWAEEGGSEIGHPVSEEDMAKTVDDYQFLYDTKLTQYDIRMMLHELAHYADHITRGDEFVYETTGYYDDADKTQINLEEYRSSPAEQRSFLAEINYLRDTGMEDKDIVYTMKMQYGGEETYWQNLISPTTALQSDMIKKARWSVVDEELDRVMESGRNTATLEQAVEEMIDYMSSDLEEQGAGEDGEESMLDVVNKMSIEDKMGFLNEHNFTFYRHADNLDYEDDVNSKEYDYDMAVADSSIAKEKTRKWKERWQRR